MPKPRLYDDFISLVRLIGQNRTGPDNAHCIYYFQNEFNPEWMAAQINNRGLTPEQVTALSDRLCQATLEGRVFWRDYGAANNSPSNHQTFTQMLTLARSINSEVPAWDSYVHSAACWNRERLRRFLGRTVIYANRLH